jgi:hypothetical protein
MSSTRYAAGIEEQKSATEFADKSGLSGIIIWILVADL